MCITTRMQICFTLQKYKKRSQTENGVREYARGVRMVNEQIGSYMGYGLSD